MVSVKPFLIACVSENLGHTKMQFCKNRFYRAQDMDKVVSIFMVIFDSRIKPRLAQAVIFFLRVLKNEPKDSLGLIQGLPRG